MFFGSSKGFYAFFPDSIRDNPYVPPIVLTDFRLFGKSVPVGRGSVLQKTINETDSLTLHYKLNSLTFEFAALSYAAPEKNRYRYKLEGFDGDWHNVGSKERLAVYTNLKAGNYTFRVQGSNQDGVWNKKGRAILITILAPWWQTWWFRSMVIILILALGYAGFSLRVRSIKKRSQELERLVEERTAQLQVVNEELEATNEELEVSNNNLDSVNKELEASNKKLEAANKELEAFSYSVSHDLRAPLRGIDGFSQVLLEDYQDKLDNQGNNYLQRIRSATQHMAQLIDDMLNLSRISRSELFFQQINLSNIVQKLANELCEIQPERKVDFIIQKEIIVLGDNHLLKIAVNNLIQNSWKYTSKHPTARIEFGSIKEGDKVIYFVRDDGAGFDMKYSQKLFGAFQRLHLASDFPGTGIGLATVQRIIHRHGGDVWAEGEVEKGATFYFTIP
jgi:signal transduction histidine kinase